MSAQTRRRSMSLWPLPGGSGSYLTTLVQLLEIVAGSARADDAVQRFVAARDSVVSSKTTRSYLHVAASLGLIDLDGPVCELTAEGRRFLRSRDPGQIRRLLVERIAGVSELLDLVGSRPRRIGLLHEEMIRQGYPWAKASQVRYRLRWLEEVGAVTRDGRGRPAYRRA